MSKHQSCKECNRDFVGPDSNIGDKYCPECDPCVECEQHRDLQAENKRLRDAVGLLNSMILGGEKHSEVSKKTVQQALKGDTDEKDICD